MGQQQYSLSRDVRGLEAQSIALALAASAAFTAPLAHAQAREPDAQTSDESASTSAVESTLQRVVVSARRQRENAQSVPMSISTFTEDALRREDLRSVTDLEKNVPGLALCCSSGQASFTFLRGIPGVQGYFAETLLLGPQGTTGSLSGHAMYFDMENVAILKGPQGTLFGMSTNGGALLFTPSRPTSSFGGHVGAELGSYGRRIVEAVVNTPINDRLKLRFGVQSTAIDGFVTNTATGNKLGGEDYTIGRFALTYEPESAFHTELYLNVYRSTGRLPPFVPAAINPTGPAQAIPGIDAVMARQQRLGYYRLVGTSLPGPVENINGVRQFNLASISTLRLKPDLQLRNIVGLGRISSWNVFDADGTPFRIFDDHVAGSRAAGPTRSLSEELQLQGEAMGQRLHYTAGLFHLQSRPGRRGTEIADLTDVYGIQSSTSSLARLRTEAIYAQGTYSLDSLLHGLKATVGYRLSVDRRWLDQASATVVQATQLVITHSPLHLHSTSHNGSYTLGMTYAATPTTMVYLNNSKGFLNGGFNTAVTQAADAPYAPESLNNFELGLKSDFKLAGMPARAHLAAYRGLYANAQVSVTSLINPGTPTQALAVLMKNAAQGRIQGLEWNVELVPHAALQLQFFGAWMKNRYTRYASLDAQGQPADLSGTPFVYTPRLKYGFSAAAILPTDASWGQLQASLSYTHQDEVVSTSTPKPQWFDKGPGFHNLDLGLNWRRVMGRSGLSATLFVTNVMGNRDANGGFGAYTSLGIVGYSPAVPRRFGLRLTQDF